jgi:hypothetical protein
MSSTVRSYGAKITNKPTKSTPYNLSSIRYSKPEQQDMAIILAFFNPAKSFRIIQNLYTVKQLLEIAEIPVYIGEVAYKEEPFVLPSSSTTYQYRTSSVMFYKENIMAQLIKKLPDNFTKVVLLDADILFVDPGWYTQVSASLDTYDVIQPFRTAVQLDISFHIVNMTESIVSNFKNKHEGYAWAFKRSWLEKYPLFEYALVGGGDTMVYHSLSNYINVKTFYSHDVTNTIDTLPLVSYVDLEIIHLPHGNLNNRQYGSRYEIIKSLMKSFDIKRLSDAVYRTSDGIFEWVPQYRDKINEALLAYFVSRNDDGI